MNISAIAEEACLRCPINTTTKRNEREEIVTIAVIRHVTENMMSYAQAHATQWGIGTRIRVGRTLEENKQARKWLANVVRKTINTCGGHDHQERIGNKLLEVGFGRVSGVQMRQMPTLAKLNAKTWEQIENAPAWVALEACRNFEEAAFRQETLGWIKAVIEQHASEKIKDINKGECTQETCEEAMEWPLQTCAPPLAALWADTQRRGTSDVQWAARTEIEAATKPRARTHNEWRESVAEAASTYRTRLMRSIARKANEQMATQARRHWEGRARNGSRTTTIYVGPKWAEQAGRSATQSLREAWRSEPALGGKDRATAKFAAKGDETPGNGHAGWWLDYGNANAFMATTKECLAPWEIAKNEGAWIDASDPQWWTRPEKRPRTNKNEGVEASQALARAMRSIRKHWDDLMP